MTYPIVDSLNAFIGATVAESASAPVGTGKRAIAQLWNPAQSGKVVYVRHISMTHSRAVSPGSINPGYGYDVRYGQVAATNLKLHPHSAHIGKPDAVCQIRTDLVPDTSLWISAPLAMEAWGCAWQDQDLWLPNPFRLDPGWGLYVATSNEFMSVPITFHIEEYDLV